MSTIASLSVRISADSSALNRELNKARSNIEKTLGRSGMNFSKGIIAGFAGVGIALAGMGAASIKAAADMSMTRTAFTQMLGSAEKAGEFIKDLQKFAAETPFEFEQVKGAAQKFLAFGFTAEQVIPTLTAVGDAAAGLGMGQDGIDRLTLALGQMAAKGKVSGEEMRQLAEAGIPAWDMLAQKMGVSIPEAMDKVSQGGVSASVGLEALVGGMQNKFGGMMDKMSQELPGLWATLTDNMGMAAIELGNTLVENFKIKEILKDAGDAMTDFTTTLQQSGLQEALKTLIPPELELAIYGVATALTIAAIPAVVNFGLAMSGYVVSGVQAFMGGIGIITGGIQGAVGIFGKFSAEMQLIKLVSMDAGVGLTGLSKVFAIGRTAALGLWTALGPIGVALLALSAIFIYSQTSGDSLSGVLSRMGVSSGALEKASRTLKSAWDILKSAFEKLMVPISGAISIFVNVASVIGGVLVHGIALVINIMAIWFNLVVDFWSAIFNFISFLAGEAVSAISSFGSYLDDLTGGALTSIIEKVKEAVSWFMNLISLMKKVDDSGGSSGADGPVEKPKEKENTPVDYSNFGGGGGSKTKSGGRKGKGKDLAKEAANTSKAIEEKWYELFSTRMGLIDRWYQEEFATLEKSKSANANYARDLQRLTEIAEEKKRAALLETERQRRESEERIDDMLKESNRAYDLSGMSAGQKLTAEMDYSYLDEIENIKRKYQSLSDEYKRLNTEDREHFIQSLQERGVAYEIATNGDLVLEDQKNKELLASHQSYLDQKNEAYVQHKELQAEIDEAFNQNSMERLQEILTEENAMRLNNYEAEQEMMQTYQEAFLAAHATTAQLVSSLYSTAFSGLSNALSDIFTGTKSISAAFKELGKTMIKTIADFVAKKIAGMLLSSAMAKASAAKDTAVGVATGKALEKAYEKAAYYASVMTFGSAAAAGSAALVAGFMASQTAMSVGSIGGFRADGLPQYANGGIVDSATMAWIGEGKHKEAVVPLQSRIIAPHLAAALELLDRNPVSSESSPVYIEYTHNGDINDQNDRQGLLNDLYDELLSARGGRA